MDMNSDGKDELVTVQRLTDPETNSVSTKVFQLKLGENGTSKDDGLKV